MKLFAAFVSLPVGLMNYSIKALHYCNVVVMLSHNDYDTRESI